MKDENRTFSIDIRPAERELLDLLEERFSPGNLSRYHHRRFATQQSGAGIYLIAWHGAEPVGHFLLRWGGPEVDPTTTYPSNTACLEAGATRPEFRRRGVATRLIHHAERLAREEGHIRIGLAVGSVDNPAARHLYERLGYRDWGGGEFITSWDYETEDGRKGREFEVCIYMFKDL